MLISLFFTLSMFIGTTPDSFTVVGYEEGSPEQIEVKIIPSRNENPLYMQWYAADAFLRMHAAAAQQGIELQVNSAFRTQEEQVFLYRRLGSDIAAIPGYSNHQLGLAVDINDVEKFIPARKVSKKARPEVHRVCRSDIRDGEQGWMCPTVKYWWLYQNAARFGFEQTVDHEKWHWVFTEGPL